MGKNIVGIWVKIGGIWVGYKWNMGEIWVDYS